MRSRPARLISTALALLALLAAGYFLFTTEQTIAERQAGVRTFDQYGRDAIRQFTDLRSSLQAYVSAGQSGTFWMPKVTALIAEATASVDGLRQTASTDAARKTLIEVAAAVTELGTIDKHAREYLNGEQPLMAADIIFSEGVQTTAEAATGVDTARLAERQALESFALGERRLEAYALAGSAASVLLLMLGVALAAPAAADSETAAEPEAPTRGLSLSTPAARGTPAAHGTQAPATAPTTVPAAAAPDRLSAAARARGLETAADVSRAFSRVQDLAGLQALAGQIASALDASGVVVWLGSTAGDDLRPIAAHGYSDKVLQMLPPVPATADNAAAAAYRSGTLQIIQERPGVSSGALVAPILAGEGCIGALAAEIRHGGESAPDTQSLATIFASQFGAVLAGSASATSAVRVAR
jgi:hypothetical protein